MNFEIDVLNPGAALDADAEDATPEGALDPVLADYWDAVEAQMAHDDSYQAIIEDLRFAVETFGSFLDERRPDLWHWYKLAAVKPEAIGEDDLQAYCRAAQLTAAQERALRHFLRLRGARVLTAGQAADAYVCGRSPLRKAVRHER
jgi:hypothetical protein